MGKIAVKINTELLRLVAGALFFAVGITLEQVLDNFHYIPLAVFIAGYIILGYEVVFRAFKNILRGEVFDENFLMALASIGAMIIGETAEAVGVMLFYQVGEYLQEMAVHKSKKSISALMDIRPDYANLKKDGGIVRVSPDTVNVGDLIIVKPGEKIPLDGVVVDGVSMLDTSSLTGESVPRKAGGGDTVLSGCINSTGLLTVEVKKTFGESTVSKILDLVENASAKKAPAEKFITKFARYYTPAVVAAAAAVAVFGPLVSGGAWFEWLRRGLIMLVVSCPCALVISIPLGFFGGIGAASRKGILIKGGNYLDALNYVDTVVFDKTGTLTKGVFRVTEIHPAAGFGPDELLELAARAEAFSGHPIARSVMEKYGKAVGRGELSDYEEIAGHGVRVNSGGRLIAAGNKKLMDSMNVATAETSAAGTKIYVAVNNEFAGSIVISDEIRSDSRNAVLELKKRGIRNTVMLTGDNPEIAAAVAKKIGLDEVYGGLLPHEKTEKLEQLKAKIKKGKIAFAGDGINDAPALAMADIGIAMGGLGSDAAIEAADVVLMTDEPSKLAEAVDIAGRTRRVVLQNIVFALGIKAVVIVLGVFGIAGMWEAVFADVGVALLAILNALRIIRSKRGAAVNSAGSVTLAHSAA